MKGVFGDCQFTCFPDCQLALPPESAKNLFFPGPEDSQTECFAVSFYVYQLLLLPATVLSLVAFVWLTRRQHNTALLLIIIPFLFVKFHLF